MLILTPKQRKSPLKCSESPGKPPMIPKQETKINKSENENAGKFSQQKKHGEEVLAIQKFQRNP